RPGRGITIARLYGRAMRRSIHESDLNVNAASKARTIIRAPDSPLYAAVAVVALFSYFCFAPQLASASATGVGASTMTETTADLNAGAVSASSPSPLALGVYRPSFPDDLSSLGPYESSLGRSISIVGWYALWDGWKSTFSSRDLEAVATHGAVPLITWEPWSGSASDPSWSLRQAILSGP